MKSDTAASDLIGVMALIAIFVTAAAIAGVALLSYPPGDAAPAMIARIANEGESISIYHDGGDPLEREHFAILVDGTPVEEKDISLIDASGASSSEWRSWKTGETLRLNISVSENPHIQIVGEGVGRTGSDWLLHDIGGGTPTGTVTTAPTETATPTPTQTTGPTPESPVANFSANVTEGNAPLTVQFTDESTGNVTAWLWDLGDGNTSTEQHPQHTYSSAGTYTVSLNASNAYGFSTETRTEYITVLNPPAAAFSATPTEGNAPLTVQFTDESTGNVTARAWDFGDGNVSSEQNPAHVYANAGTYTVTLNASNAYGSSTETKTDYITVLNPPAAAFSATPTEGNAPLTVQFTDESTGNVTARAWDFGDGNVSSEQNPAHVYANAGTYTVTLNASNAYGSSTETKTDYITVLNPPAASFTANRTSGPAPLAVQFTDTSAGGPTSWSWTFGDGNTSTVQHPIHTYATPGIYTVSLTITKAGASATETKTGYIAVYNSSSPGLVGTYYPTREFTGTPVHRIDQRLRFADALAGEWYHCNSDEEDWPNSTLGKTEQFSVVYEGYLLVPVDAVYTFYLTSDDGSRLWIDAVGEDAEPLIDNWGYHPPTEKNSTIHLSAGSHPVKVKMFENWNAAVLYLEWSSPDFERRPVESFCQGPPPVSADFTATPQNGTAPLEVQFTDTSTGGPTTWSWDFGDGGTSTERNPVHTYTAAGTYTVTLIAKNAGTSDTKTKTGYITAYGWPSPGLLGTYYPTMDWTGEGVTRIDRRIWFADNAANTAHYLNAGTDEYNWPIATLGKDDQFSVIYESYLVVPSDDTYTFYLTSDDGSWLWIDNMETALIDNGGYHSTQTMTAEIPLAAGSHKVMAKMFEGNGLAVFHLEWSSPAFARTPVDAFCRSPPPASADFTASPTSGSAPLSVQFTDTSAGEPTSWSWNYGDGGTSTEQNPVHTYIIPGTYTVTLTAENAHGSDTVTKSGYISVASPVIADFTVNVTSGEAPLAVQFTDLSSGDGITSWSWDFGDGGTSTERNPKHTYTAEGTYTVTLMVINAHGSNTVAKADYISVTKMHVSRLRVNAVTQYFWIPVTAAINYTGDPGTGTNTTPFVLSRTDSGNSGFNVTLTAPDHVMLWFWFWQIPLDFKEWRVGDTWYENRTIEVSVPDTESRTAKAYYATRLLT